MLKKVYDFNQKRNEFAYNAELERNMYAEEVEEFYKSVTLAERVDAIVDCEFVRLGTEMKMDRHDIDEAPYREKESMMAQIIMDELNNNVDVFRKIVNQARKIVADCNAIKTSLLDENGKVVKQKSLPNATLQIGVMIEDELRGLKNGN